MKIVQINKLYYPWIGGVETHVRELAEGLTKYKNFQIKAFTCNIRNINLEEELNKVKITKCASYGIFFSSPISFSFLIKLRKINADILHFHLPNPLGVIAYFVSQPKGKIVVTWHSDIVRQKLFLFFYKPILNLFLRKADVIITTSENLANNSKILKKYKNKIKIVPLSIQLPKYKLNYQISSYVKKINSEYGKFALFVGRLVYYKGIKILLQALKYTKIKMILIGEGKLKPEIDKFIFDHNLQKQVVILPAQRFSDLLAFFYASSYLVLPSNSNTEAFGIVQLEAMACKKSVISTNLPTGVPMVNIHEKTGLIVEPNNIEELRLAMLKLWSDPKLCVKLGEQGYREVVAKYNYPKMIESVKKIYEDLKS